MHIALLCLKGKTLDANFPNIAAVQLSGYKSASWEPQLRLSTLGSAPELGNALLCSWKKHVIRQNYHTDAKHLAWWANQSIRHGGRTSLTEDARRITLCVGVVDSQFMLV